MPNWHLSISLVIVRLLGLIELSENDPRLTVGVAALFQLYAMHLTRIHYCREVVVLFHQALEIALFFSVDQGGSGIIIHV